MHSKKYFLQNGASGLLALKYAPLREYESFPEFLQKTKSFLFAMVNAGNLAETDPGVDRISLSVNRIDGFTGKTHT